MPTHTTFTRIGAATLAATALMLASAVAPAAAAGKSYTLAQVKAHKSASNCWSAVNGKVYNLTKWIAKHPGGSGVIKSMCGKDATAAFKSEHGLSGKPASKLAAYKVGALAKAKPTATATATPTPTTGGTLNAALVATHNTATNCWSIVNGNVYNLTAWINAHKGGSGVIVSMCGIDASAAYTNEHSTKSKPAGKLAQYLVGAVGTAAP